MKNKYKIYGLIDPRDNKICYIGVTIRTLKKRIQEHNNPIDTNLSKIAKLSRYLKNKNLQLNIILIDTAINKEEMYQKEIELIKHFRKINPKLKNIQDGGLITLNNKNSYKRASIKMKDKKPKLGENCNRSLLTKKDVLNIYDLIKQGQDNYNIYLLYKDKCKQSTIKAIRSGQNWNHLYNEYFNKFIPSIPCSKNGLTGLNKIKILDMIINNMSNQVILNKYNKLSKSDLKRIINKTIWKKTWKIYEIISANIK